MSSKVTRIIIAIVSSPGEDTDEDSITYTKPVMIKRAEEAVRAHLSADLSNDLGTVHSMVFSVEREKN